jgi:hypothetical protein
VFHISQLKPYTPDYTPVFSTLPTVTDLQAKAAVPEQILQRRPVRKGNTAVPQILVTWTRFYPSSATWEDYHVLETRFPEAPTWGQADSSGGGDVTA